ncbi:hypothetical protein H2248_008335 [Termitomyces sp. 'cryptogamus']|nr:hypothetical protein H2248_008335 [Termitomyces sp. 'cryptogamus']
MPIDKSKEHAVPLFIPKSSLEMFNMESEEFPLHYLWFKLEEEEPSGSEFAEANKEKHCAELPSGLNHA